MYFANEFYCRLHYTLHQVYYTWLFVRFDWVMMGVVGVLAGLRG